MFFTYEHLDDVLVVTPQGDLFEYRFELLRNAYNETYRLVSEERVRHLMIDFQAAGHFGSAFIGMLIRLAKAVRKGKGEAVLCGLTPEMIDVLDSLMLLENVNTDFFWVPFPGRDAALAALRKSES